MKFRIALFDVVILVVILFNLSAYAQSARDYLQKGHSLKHAGKYTEAIEAFEKAIALDKRSASAAKSSLKQTKRYQSYRGILRRSFSTCSSQLNCVEKHFLYMGRPIHPLIIKSMLGAHFDKEPIIISINLAPAQTSNQFCCDSSYEWGVNDDGRSIVTIDYIGDSSSNNMTKKDCPMGCGLKCLTSAPMEQISGIA
ncbi:MAG: hypothetical protein HOK99_00315 [Betaproteobacteria bacterium]|nr:hypothetical protein [Betaproteobacteria bacterium]